MSKYIFANIKIFVSLSEFLILRYFAAKPDCSQQQNTVATGCTESCPSRGCETLDYTRNYKCTPVDLDYCSPTCECIDGYYHNASMVCVPKEECPVDPPEPRKFL